jgi:hypothetical protein
MALIRRLPGRARPREGVLREYQEFNAKVRKNIPAVLWDFLAPDPDQLYRWRVQLDCGCIKELFTFDKDKLPTESTYRCDHLYLSQLQPGRSVAPTTSTPVRSRIGRSSHGVSAGNRRSRRIRLSHDTTTSTKSCGPRSGMTRPIRARSGS